MKKTLALLAASTALTAAVGLPAFATVRGLSPDGDSVIATAIQKAGHPAGLWHVRDDDDDDDDHGYRQRRDRDGDDHDDDDHDDDHDDDDDDDDHGRRRGMTNPAPAGTVAPPQNGLFGSGAAPKVKQN